MKKSLLALFVVLIAVLSHPLLTQAVQTPRYFREFALRSVPCKFSDEDGLP